MKGILQTCNTCYFKDVSVYSQTIDLKLAVSILLSTYGFAQFQEKMTNFRFVFIKVSGRKPASHSNPLETTKRCQKKKEVRCQMFGRRVKNILINKV